jgi:hypothetical protein
MAILRHERDVVSQIYPGSEWVFPTRTRSGEVTFVKDAHERQKIVSIDGRVVARPGLPSPHRLRDTYSTACTQAGLHPFDIEVLTNHRPATSSVTAGYVRQSLEHLRECQEKVTAWLLTQERGATSQAIR